VWYAQLFRLRFVQRSHLRVEARLALAFRLVQALFAVHVEPQGHVGLARRPQREPLLHNMACPSPSGASMVCGGAPTGRPKGGAQLLTKGCLTARHPWTRYCASVYVQTR